MIVRSVDEIVDTERDVRGEGWASRRLLLRSDGMGYSLHDVVLDPGAEMTLWYKHHLEACYCTDGEAEIEDLATGERKRITGGTVYALDQHDRHIIRSGDAGLRLVCVFNPPLTGRETHDADGSYEPSPPD
ncbi:MAG: ectoine synthase [Chloroflexota bacterium]|nr:ectoine synthase [Chloroflexota bacterium]